MTRYTILFFLVIFLSCNVAPTEQTKLLTGKWKVVSSNVLPFEHISFCKNLNLNSLFIFDINGRINVFQTDTSKKSCITYQKFSVDSSKITFVEGDMVFFYDLLKLTKDSLIFRNTDFPKYLISEKNLTPEKDSLINLIKKEGVIVKLVKMNNGS